MPMARFCCKSKLIVIDPMGYGTSERFKCHPLFFGSATNFIKVPTAFYFSDPDENELLKYL